MLIAVDGGATHCRLALFDDAGRRLGEHRLAQPASLSVDVQQAGTTVRDGIERLAHSLDSSLDGVRLCCGLAGSLRMARRQAFIDGFAGERVVEVCTDGQAQLMGATGGLPGTCLAVGTGSVVHWKSAANEWGMAGGWGYPVGDEASAAWLGMQLLKAYVRTRDRQEPLTPLWSELGQQIGTRTEEVQAWTTCSRSSQVGTLARLVSQHAAAGDGVACALVERGADECEHLLAIAPQGVPWWICGGLHEVYRPALEARGHRFEVLRGDALDGIYLLVSQREAS